MSEKLGVIFDMDGVLVDSYQAHYKSWVELAHHHNLDLTEEQFAASFGKTSREIIVENWRITDPATVAAWDAQKEEAYRHILQAEFPHMDGAAELLTALKADGFAVAIGSSGPPQNVAVVRQCLPAGVFDAAVSGMDVTHGKPAPDIFLKAAGKLGLPPAKCLVVEDAPVGIEAARRAGMAVIAITGTASREKLAEADLVVESHREITPAIVNKLINVRCKV